jgi:hypothetical protein
MAATYVIFLDDDNVFKVGKTATETPTAYESAADLSTVESDTTARSLRRVLAHGQQAGEHELAVSS